MVRNQFSNLKSPVGSIPAGWRLDRLRAIVTKVGSGATPRGGGEVYLPERQQYALIRSQNVFDRHFDTAGLAYISDNQADELRNAQVQPSDILLNITGDGVTFGRACLVPDDILPACVNQHVSIIRADVTKCEPGYLLAYLTHPLIKPYFESFNAGGSRRAITKGHIESFEVPLPPLSEQRAIARVLSSLDDKIELNRRMNATLEETARAIFQSWFVDFEPVRAKAGGRAPAGLDAATAALFPDGFKDVERRAVPRGWRWGTLGEDFSITMGQSPPGETYNGYGEGLPFFQGRTDFSFRYPSPRIYCTAPTRVAEAGDTLVSVRAPVGDINMAAEQSCIGRGVAAIRHLSGHQSYTYYALKTLQKSIAVFEAEGTVFGSIGKKDFHNIRCLIPAPETILGFEQLILPLDQQIEINEHQSRTLAALRDALLPKLLSGELRVRDAERFVEEQL